MNGTAAIGAGSAAGRALTEVASVDGHRKVGSLIAMGAGLVFMVFAGLSVRSLAGHEASGVGPVPQDAAVADLALPDVGVADNVYQPGHSSGWHVHPGVHSVVVLTGTLTVYDSACGRHDFGPNQTYLGGNEPHLARNEGASPLGVVVTYVYAKRSPIDHGTAVPAPPTCVLV